jgi:diguanylate cyclase (GGDEF)-like protein
VKNLILAIALVLGCSPVVWGTAAPVTLTTLQAVHALSNAEASHALPVAFEATVTYAPGRESLLFVQDGGLAVFVLDSANTRLAPGDRVLVRGTTQASFRPIVVSKSVTLLRHGALPAPLPVSFDDLLHSRFDCMFVSVRGLVRTADPQIINNVRLSSLQLLVDGGYINATVDNDKESALNGLLDAEVQVTGIAGGIFDGKMQQTGVLLHAPSLANVQVLKRASTSPHALPVTPMGEIMSGYHVQDQSQRIRVHGTITYYDPGRAVVLQDGSKSLWITTLARSPMQIGDLADATGFPGVNNGALVLTHGEIEDSHIQAPITPQPATWHQLALWSANRPEGHLYDLVSIEGEVVMEAREAAQDEYLLSANGLMFSAIFLHQNGGAAVQLPPMKKVPVGSRIRVTGICMINDTNPFYTTKEASFTILLRSFGDVKVVAKPSLLSIHNLVFVVCSLLLVLFGVLARGLTIERKMRRQTTALAQIEQRRSRILEDINGSRPLAEIIEQITNLVSFRLCGAPCWCQITEGSRLGKRPPDTTSLRIVQYEILSRSGPPLGVFFAACDSQTKPSEIETEVLSMAAGLATLAIETRRLYSNLRHRSEFDLLTDIHNRFSLNKHLKILIEDARRNAGIFGLIYIDLDEFKQVNDLYGHHIGDVYLREVAQRLKQQLRSHDLLARLGGDEFAVLLPLVSSRARVDEIALRLEHCFSVPFVLEGRTLKGAASFGIAIYPDDGDTGDDLLNVADAAMYVVKNSRKQAANKIPERT